MEAVDELFELDMSMTPLLCWRLLGLFEVCPTGVYSRVCPPDMSKAFCGSLNRITGLGDMSKIFLRAGEEDSKANYQRS